MRQMSHINSSPARWFGLGVQQGKVVTSRCARGLPSNDVAVFRNAKAHVLQGVFLISANRHKLFNRRVYVKSQFLLTSMGF